jgi:hypothetical protein
MINKRGQKVGRRNSVPSAADGMPSCNEHGDAFALDHAPAILPLPWQKSQRTFPPESQTIHLDGSDIPIRQIVLRPPHDGQVRFPVPKHDPQV